MIDCDLDSCDEDIGEEDLDESVTPGGLLSQLVRNQSKVNMSMKMLQHRHREAENFMSDMFPVIHEVQA